MASWPICNEPGPASAGPGFDEALAVFDSDWRNAIPYPEPDFNRIQLPPVERRRKFLSVDWRKHHLFEFMLPPIEELSVQRSPRDEHDPHHVD